jgi:hypothetical protein
MAKLPFNVDEIDADKVGNQSRTGPRIFWRLSASFRSRLFKFFDLIRANMLSFLRKQE